MANNSGEMPFLDHLEELRKRILLSLAAIVVGFCVGWWLTTHFELIKVLSAPVAPLVAGGKLMVTSATGPFMIVMKFAFLLGVVLASPFIVYQAWLFLAPALTSREKRAIVPSLGIGFVLFMGGAALGWFLVVPPAIDWLMNFQAASFDVHPTYDSYMQLIVHLLVGMGIAAELPLVMVLLSLLGIMSYRVYTRFRRYAVLGAFIGGAILAPTPEVTMMILFTIPLLLLYEVGVAGAWLVERRRARAARIAASALLLAFFVMPHRMSAQVPPPPPQQQQPPGAPGDTNRKVTGQGVQVKDSGALKRLGLPTAPRRTFAPADSVLQRLLGRKDFAVTRYTADSVRYVLTDGQILLGGRAATLRDGDQLEANQILYDDKGCLITGTGEPQLFPKGQSAVIGSRLEVTICAGAERGLIADAYTSLANGGTNWYVRGNLAVDSSGKRLYGSETSFTSCDLPDPHYHFVAGQIKWVSQSVIVARPAVLYIRDVPVAWLPFIFQDTKRDRSSGILIPRFGFNDIVRTNRNYNRTVSNVGYYWAPNDYIDVTASLDWYANRYTQYTGLLNYRWLDRFVTGALRLSRQVESEGSSSNVLHWDHRQNFNVATSLVFNVNYQSDSRVQLNNAIDPLASTAQITSQLNLTKRFKAGTVAIGGSRSEQLGTGAGQMTLPQVSIQPNPIPLGLHVLWSPSLSGSSTTGFNNLAPPFYAFTALGEDTIIAKTSSRNTSIELNTPIRFYDFTWQNRLSYRDESFVGRTVVTERVPNPNVPGDSITVTTARAGNYLTGLDWDTGINLPLLFATTWKITPSIGVTNATSGRFMVRSPGSNGRWVTQGKKVQAGIDAAPTFFAISNGGLGPYSKFRYSFAPAISMRYSPAATVSQEFARAIGSVGGPGITDIPATGTASISLHQNFEGKLRPPPGDTTSDPTRLPKRILFSISSSAIGYDFVQATLPHRTGWTTAVLTNQFRSDLIPGITLSTTHSLWEGQVGTDSAKFSPFLAAANASFSISGRTFRSIAQFLHLVKRDSLPNRSGPTAITTPPIIGGPSYSSMRSGYGPPAARGFSASFTYTLQRFRPNGTTAQPVSTEPSSPFGSSSDSLGGGSIIPFPAPPAQSQLGISMSFAPTPFWSVSWNTQYDITHGTFESQNIVLQRDLHDWRAQFTFTKNTNGNFALFFSVFLLNLPDIKFDYNQTTLQQAPIGQ